MQDIQKVPPAGEAPRRSPDRRPTERSRPAADREVSNAQKDAVEPAPRNPADHAGGIDVHV
jgi:hypothetical protein